MSEPTATCEKKDTVPGRSFRIRIEKRLETPAWWNAVTPVISIALALLFGAIFLKLTGYSPITVYKIMFKDTFGTRYGITETLVRHTPCSFLQLACPWHSGCSSGISGAKVRFIWGPWLHLGWH